MLRAGQYSAKQKQMLLLFLVCNKVPQLIYFIYLFISDTKASIYAHTRKKKKKKKKDINSKRCTIEKYKFKTKLAQNIGNKTIYTISPMTSMT